jgi:hypothetical protein
LPERSPQVNATSRTVATDPSGILTAHVVPGHTWDAVRALRDGIREVRRSGNDPHLEFLYGIAEDGRLTNVASAAVIVLGYAG